MHKETERAVSFIIYALVFTQNTLKSLSRYAILEKHSGF